MDKINEGLNYGDLKRLIQPLFGVDQYKSKMGDDRDVCVISFTVFGKEPANDLANFVEKSYDWVLDADVSSGELSDGNYLVFIEVERSDKVPECIIKMLQDLRSIANMKLNEWEFKYYKSVKRHPATPKMLAKHIISTPEQYEVMMGEVVEEGRQLNRLRAIANVPVKPEAIADKELLQVQSAAGIR